MRPGVAFYGFLAPVPLSAQSCWSTVRRRPNDRITQHEPADIGHAERCRRLVGEQLMNAVQVSDGKKGSGLPLASGLPCRHSTRRCPHP